jgi:Protein of unknown function (DUF2924)
MSNENVEAQNFNLMNLSATELGKTWRQNLSEKIPDHLPKSILARILAYRIQSERQGGLSKKAIAYLKPIQADLREGKSAMTPYPDEQKLKAGCQLVREHDGINHRVTVVDGGYEWQGKTFASLSSVAKAITGTNWNGHRFFGLKAKARLVADAES